DHGFVATLEALEEDGDDSAFERRVLTRSEDVAEAEHDVVRAVDAVPAAQVFLGAELRDPVRRDGPQRAGFRRRAIALAVDRPAPRRGRRQRRRRRPARRARAPGWTR